MKLRKPRATGSRAADRYLAGLGEPYLLLSGADQTRPPGVARIQVAAEIRLLVVLTEGEDAEALCRDLAQLEAAYPEDYFIFLGPEGERARSVLDTFAPPGLRRRFHLRLFQAEASGRLEDPEDLLAALSEAAGVRLRFSAEGVRSLDEVMATVARPLHGLPTLPPAVRAVSGMAARTLALALAAEAVPVEGRPGVYRYAFRKGTLRLDAGRLARRALTCHEEAGLLAGCLEAALRIARNPREFPPPPHCAWLGWHIDPDEVPDPVHGGQPEAVEQARRPRWERFPPPHPEEVLVWRCPTCRTLQEERQVPAGTLPPRLEQLAERLRLRLAREEERSCSACGAGLVYRSRIYAGLFHYLEEPGGDLHLEILRLPSGKWWESWGWSDGPGRFRRLPGIPDPEAFREAFGRGYSLAEEGVAVLRDASLSGFPEARTAGPLAWVMAFPPGEPSRMQARVEELLNRVPWQERALRLHLSDFPRWNLPVPDWIGPFSGPVAEGLLGSAILVDWEAFQELVREELERSGLEVEPLGGGEVRVRDASSWVPVDLLEELLRGLEAGLYPETTARRLAGRARSRLKAVGEFMERLEEWAPPGSRLQVDRERQVARLVLPDGEPRDLDVARLCQGWGGGDLDRELRFHLTPALPSLDRCRCGEPAHLTARLRDKGWMETLDPALRSQAVADREGEIWRVFFLECSHHQAPLKQGVLDELQVGRGRLESAWWRDLDRNAFRVGALLGPRAGPLLAAFLGPDAASLAAHPSLVSGALQAVDLVPSGKAWLEVPDGNLLLVREPGSDELRFRRFREAARQVLRLKGLAAGPLSHREEVELGAPRGRFQISWVHRAEV